jgi:hypothetical protein
MELEHNLCTQEELVVVEVADKFFQFWPTFRYMASDLLEDITPVALVERVSLVVNDWTQLAGENDNIQR